MAVRFYLIGISKVLNGKGKEKKSAKILNNCAMNILTKKIKIDANNNFCVINLAVIL